MGDVAWWGEFDDEAQDGVASGGGMVQGFDLMDLDSANRYAGTAMKKHANCSRLEYKLGHSKKHEGG